MSFLLIFIYVLLMWNVLFMDVWIFVLFVRKNQWIELVGHMYDCYTSCSVGFGVVTSTIRHSTATSSSLVAVL